MHFEIGAGVTMDLTPQIQSRDELKLRVGITASAPKPFAVGGSLEHPLLTRNQSITTLILRHGELNLLCGLNNIPGLTYIPLLDKGLDKGQFADQGLVIALMPRIQWP